jgi:hypothetical protein
VSEPEVTTAATGRRRGAGMTALLGVAAVFWAQYVWVRPTNFSGADEWLCIDLASRGALAVPYANRPLVFLWTALAARAWPHHLGGYWLVHGLYLMGAGLLSGWLAGRLVPGGWGVAFVAGVFACTWAPLDFMRLDTILLAGYSGFALATMLAIVLLVEAWRARSAPLLALSAGCGFLAGLGFEGVIPTLAAAPLILPIAHPGPPRRLAKWLLLWEAAVLVAAGLVLWPLLAGGPSYQTGALGLDPHPGRFALRLGRILAPHLHPIVSSPLSELVVPGVGLAVAIFVAFLALVTRRESGVAAGDRRLDLLRLGLTGLALAALANAAFALSPAIRPPARTQVLSAPGVGLALAAGIALAASGLPRRWRKLTAAILAAWVVAVGTGRVIAMQEEWDRGGSVYPAQHATLAALTAQAPGLRPGTLVVLLDETGAWPMSFTFRHAVSYLYPQQAIGLVYGAEGFLYPSWTTTLGWVVSPQTSIRGAWGVEPSAHPWETVVVARLHSDRRLELLEHWPADALPALPPGARYAPRARIIPKATPPPSRAILTTLPPDARR